MNGEEFPDELNAKIASTLRRYEKLGWTDIEVGWPTASVASTMMVFVHATTPSGERVHTRLTDDSHLIDKLDAFFASFNA